MEIRVFDRKRNVVTIRREDVVMQKWINRRYEYHTLTQIYYGASDVREEAELQASLGFFKVSVREIINLKYIDRFVKGGVFVDGIFYKLSKGRLAELKRQMRIYIPNSH